MLPGYNVMLQYLMNIFLYIFIFHLNVYKSKNNLGQSNVIGITKNIMIQNKHVFNEKLINFLESI